MENLLRQREELLNQIRELDNLSATGTEKILAAIKNQRWFFFKNNKYILLDRDTALIWANLDYFPHAETYDGKKNCIPYLCTKFYVTVKNLMREINSGNHGGFNNWKIPSYNDFWKMIKDKSFPFQQGINWEIKNKRFWCIEEPASIASKLAYAFLGVEEEDREIKTIDLSEDAPKIVTFDCSVIPCNESLKTQVFSATPREVLEIFTRNNLEPIFDNYEANNLYRKIYVDKATVNKQRLVNKVDELNNKIAAAKKLAEEEAQRKKLEASKPKLTANFDYRPILSKYDVKEIDKSAIKYFDASRRVADEFLNILQDYEAAQSETIAASLKISLKLKAKYTDNPHLTPEENSLLADRQKFLAKRLELATDVPKKKILSVKAQAEKFSERLEKINDSENYFAELAALESEPRADFELLVENLARIILDTQRKVDFFAEHKDFVASIVEAQSAWSDDYKAFKTSLREELTASCREDSIDDEIFAAWYDDWRTKRFAIEQRFLPPVEFALKGNLSDATENILNVLRDYREAVDRFYLHERKNIYQKFAFTAGGDLQEKFETESELYKLAEKLQRDLQAIIFSRDATEERVFLLRWAEPLLNLPIDEISKFIRDKELDAISEEVLTQFAALKRQNFATYLADAQAYGEAIQKREKEFNALIFRMRKDLHKS